MRWRGFFISFIFLTGSLGMAFPQPETPLKVLQLNVWLQGSQIENGVDAIADIIIQSDADLVTMSEVGPDFMSALISVLGEKKSTFYGIPADDCGVISKFPILKQDYIYNPSEGHNGIVKTVMDVKGKMLCLYSAHLDYQHYGAFIPRGYDGQTWKKISAPITDTYYVLSFNRTSYRDEQIDALIKDALMEIKEGNIVIVGGDFNEPSHIDWGNSVKNLFDHNGAVIPWECSLALQKAGFSDAYREIYPNPVTHPGFTWPSDNPSVSVDKLSWAPDVDERDRLDYIFYSKKENIRLDSIVIVGPQASIIKGQRAKERTDDPIMTPNGEWPSDHKGILAIFHIY